ncbi:hypothetical protein COCCADRAFT_102858, partial [Bipolaris zeicola 26-R-13]
RLLGRLLHLHTAPVVTQTKARLKGCQQCSLAQRPTVDRAGNWHLSVHPAGGNGH